MKKVIVVDADALAKLGKANNLDILIKNADVYVTSTVYSELSRGVAFGAYGAINAFNWIQTNPSVNIDRTSPVLQGEGKGERSIVEYVDTRKAVYGDQDNFIIVSDNKKDFNKYPLIGRKDTRLIS